MDSFIDQLRDCYFNGTSYKFHEYKISVQKESQVKLSDLPLNLSDSSIIFSEYIFISYWKHGMRLGTIAPVSYISIILNNSKIHIHDNYRSIIPKYITDLFCLPEESNQNITIPIDIFYQAIFRGKSAKK